MNDKNLTSERLDSSLRVVGSVLLVPATCIPIQAGDPTESCRDRTLFP